LDLKVKGEVLVVDNGSEDGSQVAAARAGARVLTVPEKGYGSALKAGIKSAKGRFVVMGDADCSYDWSDVAPFYERLKEGFELVMGCRLPSGGGTIEKNAMPFLHRWLGNPALSLSGRILFKSDIRDFHCGMRGFLKSSIEKIELVTSGMEFASEMVIKSELAGLRISQVPITLSPDGRSRSPHLRTWRDGWRHLRFMLLHSPKWVFLVPGSIALASGLLGFSSLLIVPRSIGTNLLLACSFLLIVGVQWICFGMSARIFGTHHGLLPDDPGLSSAFNKIKLESGILLGFSSLVVGVLLVVLSADVGDEVRFRYVIPGFTFVAGGFQIVLSSFFFSVLGLKYSKDK